MAKATTDEMIALFETDIKIAEEIGDTEFVAVIKEAKTKLERYKKLKAFRWG